MSIPRAPGYSIDLSDAARVACRHMRGLGGVVPIDFMIDKGNGYRVTLWYRNRSNQLVHAIQLRRELEGPYFHQFIVFELDGGELFRIDRRLRPNETAPLNSLQDQGIPAFDTIEPVSSWEDPLFPPSDCLIAMEFKVQVHLTLILRICHGIQTHPLAKVYTLQRYNCYFFAQTVALCVAYGVSDWGGSRDWHPRFGNRLKYHQPGSRRTTLSPNVTLLGPETVPNHPKHRSAIISLATTELSYDRIVKFLRHLIEGIVQSSDLLTHVDTCKVCNRSNPMIHKQRPSQELIDATKPLFKTYLKEEQARLSAFMESIERDEMDIWEVDRSAFSPIVDFRDLVHKQREEILISELFAIWRSSTLRRILKELANQAASNVSKVGSCHAWKQCQTKRGIRGVVSPSTSLLAGHKLITSISQELSRVEEALVARCEETSSKLLQPRINISKQKMTIRINHEKIQDNPQSSAPNDNSKILPQYESTYKSAPWRDKKARQGQEPEIMRESTIVDMQLYLTRLIYSHSLRVEQYKWATQANATEVYLDITRVMAEVWKELVR